MQQQDRVGSGSAHWMGSRVPNAAQVMPAGPKLTVSSVLWTICESQQEEYNVVPGRPPAPQVPPGYPPHDAPAGSPKQAPELATTA